MFKLEVPRVQLQEYCDTGAYYYVKFKRIAGGNPLSHFLEGEILSASKMLSKFREIIKEEVKEIEGEIFGFASCRPDAVLFTYIPLLISSDGLSLFRAPMSVSLCLSPQLLFPSPRSVGTPAVFPWSSLLPPPKAP